MRLRFLLLCLGLVFGASAAQALTYETCTQIQRKLVDEAAEVATDMALRAAASVGETPEYETWFGKFSPENGEVVRRTLKNILKVLRDGDMKAICATGRDLTCKDAFAWVDPSSPYGVHLCADFFIMPTMRTIDPSTSTFETGTMEGTLIHEISHFVVVGGTDDHCYERTVCANMAARDPWSAIRNADSYQYFTEDLTLFPQVGRTN